MARDSKLGTFGGVFTPSLLTILGVIMYLRMPWVIGVAGLYEGLAIVLVAHVISICTGLSISSIATDKRVGAGGPYYIVSRTLGLPIGGTLGLALFLGLSFSISLYVIGFSESLLSVLRIEATPAAIRICGTVTIVCITAVTFLSTALAIKTQYLIFSLIALSLLSVFLGGSHPPPLEPHLAPVPDVPSPATLFGIFFPAVTGFTAGVNMSGDLRDPRRSIPRGTMAAIAAGMVIYVSLAVFVALRVERTLLLEHKDVLIEIAAWPPVVVAGIWGATLSSALGCVLGAPRILQALSNDRVTPRFFARGYGKTNEPRNALLLAFVIGEGGILIAELDSIARIVSMVFLTTYGFLNLTSAIESWASPDFRPAFRIPKLVSVVGATASVLVMIQLDLMAMAGATVLMAALFAYLKRKQLKLDSGDTWEGIWSSLVRSGLYRLTQERHQRRNWRPNILLFRRAESDPSGRVHQIARLLTTGSGMLSDFALGAPGAAVVEPARPPADDESQLGVFRLHRTTTDPYATMEGICRDYGFAGLRPNTVLMDLHAFSEDPEAFRRLLGTFREQDLNVLLFASRAERDQAGERKRVDVWWTPEAGNLGLSLALLRFITGSRRFASAAVRLFLVVLDSSSNDYVRTTARRLLVEARVEATLRVLNAELDSSSVAALIRRESTGVDLTLVGLPNDADDSNSGLLAHAGALLERLEDVLFVGASQQFSEAVTLGRQASISLVPPPVGDGKSAELPALELPATPALATATSAVLERHQALVGPLYEHGFKILYGQNIALLRELAAAAGRHYGALDATLAGAEPDAQRVWLERARSALLAESGELLSAFAEGRALEQRSVIEARVAAFLEAVETTPRERKESQTVERAVEDFAADPRDDARLRRFKRRRRLGAWLRRGPARYRVPFGRLRAYYAERAIKELLLEALREYARDSLRLAVRVGKTLSAPHASADETRNRQAARPADSLAPLPAPAPRETIEALLRELVDDQKRRLGRQQWSLLERAQRLAGEYARDVDRLDVMRFARLERKPPRERGAWRGDAGEFGGRWFDLETSLLRRAEVACTVARFQQSVVAVATRAEQSLSKELGEGVVAECTAFAENLRVLRETVAGGRLPADALSFDGSKRFDARRVIDDLARDIDEALAALPEVVALPSDESVIQMEEAGSDAEVESVELPLRRLAQFLAETEFCGAFGTELAEIMPLEQGLVAIASDVVRLLTFHTGELRALGESGPEAVRAHLLPVIDSGLERLDAELERLSSLSRGLRRSLRQRLQTVLDKTQPYELTHTANGLEQHIRLHQGRQAVQKGRSLVRRAAAQVRTATVNLLYRQSAGVVLARRLRSESRIDGHLVPSVLRLASTHAPRRDVIEALPFYYRQLFVGQSTVDESFWVGRDEELATAREGLSARALGKRGALLVHGERGSGKTALCQRLVDKALEGQPVRRVHPVPGGTADVAGFVQGLRRATGLAGEAQRILRNLPEGTVLLIDDLELWWERSGRGFEVIDLLLDAVDRHGDRLLFVFSLNTQALRFIDRFRPLSDRALAVLECGPLNAESIKRVVTARHASTGLTFELDGKVETDLGPVRLARLFTRHFEYADGCVGAALRSWITHIHAVNAGRLSVRVPEAGNWDLLDELRSEWVALLLQLVLHKQLARPRLRRIAEIEARALERDVDTLMRMGLIVEGRQDVLEVNPYLQHRLVERFARRGLLA